MKLIFATHNPGKLQEMRELLSGLAIDVVSADEAGVTEEPAEDGKTFKENALKKARFVADQTKEWALADDSGICIDALGGEPGVFTSRYGGPGKNPALAAWEKMKNVPEEKRGATFFSIVALVSPQGQKHIFEGSTKGHIAPEPRGLAHPKLPFDAIFIPEEYKQTYAEMDSQLKNSLSHRGRAFVELKKFLQTIIWVKI